MTFAPRLLHWKNPSRILTPLTGSGASTGRSGAGRKVYLSCCGSYPGGCVLGPLPTGSCAFGVVSCGASCLKTVKNPPAPIRYKECTILYMPLLPNERAVPAYDLSTAKFSGPYNLVWTLGKVEMLVIASGSADEGW